MDGGSRQQPLALWHIIDTWLDHKAKCIDIYLDRPGPTYATRRAQSDVVRIFPHNTFGGVVPYDTITMPNRNTALLPQNLTNEKEGLCSGFGCGVWDGLIPFGSVPFRSGT
ncbi:GD12095 [Drosophila simulans]|uniref:GD12095 n=1 Tax=Drosophila simulans TaxID=7240 RepID=B4QK90_DROSI|nr:GD12095 [Drosophila simulans]